MAIEPRLTAQSPQAAPPISATFGPPVVFLHLPKTAGQTIHAALLASVGAKATSPVRHPRRGEPAFPAGFRLYSGHLDWADYPSHAPTPFAFTVLRDPRERLASFYLYLRARAQALDPVEAAAPEAIGLHRIRHATVADYFFAGPPAWQRFVRDHFANPYCHYLATGRFRGHPPLDHGRLLRRALCGVRRLGGVYRLDDLAPLARDLAQKAGITAQFSARLNRGPQAGDGQRWATWAKEINDPALMARLESLVAADLELMRRIWPD